MLTHATLHYTILREIIEKGFAPSLDELSTLLNANQDTVKKALYDLQEYHGVVLHPNEAKVWAIHPFSLTPTSFYVTTKNGEWWGNCAWCSLGIAALLKEDVKITTTLGAETKQVEINIIDGEIQEKNYFIHFPIPMKNAWDNVIFTCSTMLLFENEQKIDEWSKKHNIPKGDIQPVDKIWQFSKKWYGNHLNSKWKKWTMDEAKEMFIEFELTGRIWSLGEAKGRF